MNRTLPIALAAALFFAGAGAYALFSSAAPQSQAATQAPAKLSAPAPKTVPTSRAQIQLSFAPAVARVAPAVVNVYSRAVVQTPANPFFNDPFFQQFFGGNPQMRQRVEQSLGSGVIVRSDGLILTNNHVIAGGQDIVVALADKREFKAKVLLADPRSDLAVLQIDAHGEKLPTIEFGDSDSLQVGDIVLAVGDPFGVGQTVTMGIVSALARTQVSDSYQYFIQTDAAINPGNSGGALVTSDGKLVGINTAIYSRSGGSVGIGFAIPVNLARRVVEGVEGSKGQVSSVRLAWIGADGQAVTSEIATSLGLARPAGVLVKEVYPGGPVGQAGVKTGDIILSVDGQAVDDMQALSYRIATHRAGDTVNMRIQSGKTARNIAVKIALPPEEPPPELATIGGRNPLTGAKVENLSPAISTDLQLDLFSKGVAIAAIGDNSIAAGQGFQTGDIIRSVNGTAVGRVGDLTAALESAGGRWNFIVERGGQRLSFSVEN